MVNRVDVVVGTVGRAHGLRGEVTVRVHSDYAEQRFADGAVLGRGGVGGPPLEVVSSRWQGDMLLVSFRGITDRSQAESVRGAELWASVEAGETAENEYHDAALIGLDVRRAGVTLGRISTITHHPVQDLLVILTPDGERLVPFVTALVPVVDVAAGYVEVADLPGLIDPPAADETQETQA
ncbi:MAG: ribosome maturation factor RimM [Micropruina sp.]|nr:ribosome maturation factor RimM [Micropruina sp.]